MDIEGALIREIIVEPVMKSSFDKVVAQSLIYAIAHDVNVTVLFQLRPFRIAPRTILQEIFEQHKEEEGD